MKVGKHKVRLSILHIAVFGFFTLLIIFYVLLTHDYGLLVWGIPILIMLVLIPMGLNYMSQEEYANLLPYYEAEAKKVRIREITPAMISQPVRIEGLVEETRFTSLNRPHYIIADRTGVITVKMFTTPPEKIKKDTTVEVLGQVIRRYIFTGDPVINGVTIREI